MSSCDVITFVSHTNKPGGGELALRRYLEATALDVRLVTMESGGVWQGLERVVVPVSGLRGLRSQLRPGGLVVANSMRAAFLTALVAPSGARLVYWVRDGLTDSAMSPFALVLTKAVTSRRVFHYLANSEWTADTIRRALHAPSENTSVVYSMSGVNAGTTLRPRTDPNAPVRLLYAGRIARWKGADVAVRAVRNLQARGVAVTLTIAGAPLFGEDAYAAELANLVSATAGVQMIGHVTDMAGLVTQHDIALHCSVRPEPFGQVIVQALAAGLPTVASSGGGPSEILGRTPFNLRYPPGDSSQLAQRVVEVLTNYQLLSQWSMRRAAKFADERCLAETDQVLQRMLRRAK